MKTHSDLLDNGKMNSVSGAGKRIRRIVGVALLLFGIYYGISTLVQLKYHLEPYLFASFNDQLYFVMEFMYDYHVVILISTAELVSGLLFLLNNRNTWMLGMIAVLSRILSLFFLFYPSMIDVNSVLILFSVLLATIYIGLLALLVSKPLRYKYAPSKNTWMLVIGIVLIIFAENMRMIRF